MPTEFDCTIFSCWSKPFNQSYVVSYVGDTENHNKNASTDLEIFTLIFLLIRKLVHLHGGKKKYFNMKRIQVKIK